MLKKIAQKIGIFGLSLMLALSFTFGAIPAKEAQAAATYDVNAALSYAQSHWNDGQGLCAEFVSRCAKAGGINMSVITTTYECYKAVCSATGLSGQDLKLESNGYASYSKNSSILAAGDIVVQWCYTCNLRPHILICGGYNANGYATFYAHNSALNNGLYRLNKNSQHKSTCNIGAKVIHLSSLGNNNPQGCLDGAEGGLNTVRVRGWGFDPNGVSQPIKMHIYIGGPAGSGEGHEITANTTREDVNNVYGVGIYHGFDANIRTALSGIQDVYVYAINIGAGTNQLIGMKTVNITKDSEAPTISDVRVTDVNANGYTVTCKVEDAGGVARVQFPTWTPENGQDDLAENWWDNPICSGTQNGTTWSYRVNVSDHNNEEGVYRTHIYAYDSAGNRTGAIEVADVLVEKEKTEGADKTGEPQNPGTENAGIQNTITFSINAFDNLDYTFQTIDGGNVSSKALASKDVTLLVFGRTTCASTWLTLKSIAESSWIHDPEVSVFYVETEGADAQAVKSCIDRYAQIGEDASQYRLGCEKIVFCHDADNKNEEARKMYHALSGKQGTIYLPMTVLIDRNNVVREILTNYQTADEILPVMNQVIDKGNEEEKEEDKKTEGVKASNVHLSRTSLIWNGKQQRPSVIARDGQGRQIGSADYTVTYSNNKSVGQAAATIIFKNNFKGTVKKTFLIKPKGTSIFRLTPKKKGFAVKWKKQALQTTGYELQYCINSKFKGAKTLKNIKATTTSKSVTKLKAKKKYYVRIRTYKNAKVNGKATKIYSGWSKAKKVIAKK